MLTAQVPKRPAAMFGVWGPDARAVVAAMSARMDHLGQHECIIEPTPGVALGLRADAPCGERSGADALMANDRARAFYDWQRGALVLAMPRSACRSFHIASLSEGFVFSTELAALQGVPGLSLRMSPDVAMNLLATGDSPRGTSFLAGVTLAVPGHTVLIRDHHFEMSPLSVESSSPHGEGPDAFADFRRALVVAVREMTDGASCVGFALTPGFGPLLALGALRWCLRDRPLCTYAVGFGHDDPFLERAQNIADHFCTEHHPIIVNAAQARAMMQELVRCTEDPLTPEGALDLLLIARHSAAEIPMLISGAFADPVIRAPRHWPRVFRTTKKERDLARPAEIDLACSQRVHGAATIGGGSLFEQPVLRECSVRALHQGAPDAGVGDMARALSAGLLARRLLAEPMLSRPLHPARGFVSEMAELCRDLSSEAGHSHFDDWRDSHCLPRPMWTRVMLALWARSFVAIDRRVLTPDPVSTPSLTPGGPILAER